MTNAIAGLEERLAAAEAQLTALGGMIDTDRRVVRAASLAVETDSASPQVIEAPDGNLQLGVEGSWRVVDALTVGASHTGDTDETTLWAGTIPANSMGPNGIARISLEARPHAGSYLRVYFGQILAANKIGGWYHATMDFYVMARDIHVWNKDAANAQGAPNIGTPLSLGVHWVAWGTVTAMTEDTTQDIDVYVTAQNAAGGDTSYLHSAFIEVCKRD